MKPARDAALPPLRLKRDGFQPHSIDTPPQSGAHATRRQSIHPNSMLKESPMHGNKPPAGQSMVIVAIVALIAAGSALTVLADSRTAAFMDVGDGAMQASPVRQADHGDDAFTARMLPDARDRVPALPSPMLSTSI